VTYTVHEIFLTAQGEGANLGRTAVFIRFAGCNLWSGREEDRADAVCRFCDTEFRGGTRYGREALVEAAAALWPAGAPGRFCVLTGGEPLLQVDAPLLDALRAAGFTIAVETNGTLAPPPGLDWICVSPKGAAPLVLEAGDELKLVYPQASAMPERFAALPFANLILQPMDGPDQAANTAAAVRYCMAHPRWRLGLQTHKVLGIA